MRYRILGEPAALSDGIPLSIRGRRQRSLLALLLAHRNTRIPEFQLMDWLWGEDDDVGPKALQITVSRLRRALGPGAEHLETMEGGYGLRPEPDSVDADRFLSGLADGRVAFERGDPADAVARVKAALDEWTGPAFGSHASERWAVGEAAKLDELRLQARQLQCEALLAGGSPAEAVDDLNQLVLEHPEREAAAALLMTALYRSGRQREALETYQVIRRRLVDEWGLEPSPALERLERAVLQQAPELTPARAPKTPANLPHETTSFIGRTSEMNALRDQLIEHRLVTLTGPGGSGKTRLAVEFGRSVGASFPGGVTFVDLLSTTSPELVLPALADAVGEHLEPGRDVAQIISEHIGAQRTLLILDNLEQVVESGSELADLVRRAPGLHLLATSRAPLRVRGEAILAVAPLAVPPDDPELPLEAILASESASLFVDRAAIARPGWEIDRGEGQALASLCRRLDGIPLALELAAAATSDRSVGDVLRNTDPLLRSLGGGLRDLPVRQQSMLALVEWSHGLLSEASRRVFDRLGVFSGGWTLNAATAVCGDVVDPHATGGIEATLEDLVLHNLVQRRETPSGSRYSMLETIQGFARERLRASDIEDRVRRNHATHVLQVAREFYDLYREREPMPVLETETSDAAQPQRDTSWAPARWEPVEAQALTAEGANLRSALDWALRADHQLAASIALAACYYWYLTGRSIEGHRYLRAAVDVTLGPPLVRAHLLLRAGVLAIHANQFDEGEALLAESLALVEQFGTDEQVARVLMPVAWTHTATGGYADATRLLQRAANISIEAGNAIQAGHLYNYLCQNLALAGEIEPALDAGRSAINWFKADGAQVGLGIAYGNLAAAEHAAGMDAEARAHLRRSLETTSLLRWEREHAWNLMLHGVLQLTNGKPTAATKPLREGLRLCAGSGDRWMGALTLEALGRAEAAQGALDRAASVLGAAEQLRQQLRSPLPPLFRDRVNQALASARAGLSPDRFARHRAAYRQLGFSRLVQLIAPGDT